MEELNNQTIDNTNMEVIDTVEVLETNNEDLGQTNNTAIIVVALATAVGAGIYGFKKFKEWRKSKKETVTIIRTVDEEIVDVDTELNETENDI